LNAIAIALAEIFPGATIAPTGLNTDQARAYGVLHNAITGGEASAILDGSAGSGKTYVITHLLKAFPRREIWLTAPTHRAVHVLRDMAQRIGETAKTSTIHSLLGLQPQVDLQRGKIRLMQAKPTETGDAPLIVLDEASMVSRELLQHIRQFQRRKPQAQVIFCGDDYQLAPVFESQSPALNLDAPRTRLKRIVRQASNSPILRLADQLRAAIDGGPVPKFHELASTGETCWLPPDDFETALLEAFTAEGSEDTVRALTWTNGRTRELNQKIRRHRIGPQADQFPLCPGETAVAVKPLVKNGKIRMMTGETVLIGSVEDWLEPTYRIPALMIEAINRSYKTINVKMIRYPEGIEPYKQALKATSKKAKELQEEFKQWANDKPYPKVKDIQRRSAWSDFFYLKDTLFTELRPVYASTIHKAQGSTYETVFVDLSDVARNTKNHEILRLLYVAASRPTNQLVLTGQLPPRIYEENSHA